MGKRFWEINDVHGNLLYSGEAVTRRELVAELAARGASFAGADLSGHDLSHLCLDGLDFSGADLSGSRLRGSTANKAVFDFAILDGVKGEGMTAKDAKFRNTRIGRCKVRGTTTCSTFDGSIFTHSRFDGSQVEHASFEGASMSGTSFALAKVRRSIFRSAFLNNTDYSRGELFHNDFSGAEMTATSSATRIPRASLPDRTSDTVAVGNNYTDAVMDETTPAFKWDRVFGKIANQVAWGVSAAAMLAATSFIPMETGEQWLGHYVGQGVAVVGLVGLANMLLEKLGDRIKDKIEDQVLKLQLAVREAALEVKRRGGNIKETVAAVAFGTGFGPLRRALGATAGQVAGQGVMPFVKSITAGGTDIMLCDRRHMAAALEWIATSFGHSRLLEHDLVITRTAEGGDAPSILKFFAGGGMAAFWTREGEVTRALSWDADSMKPDAWPDGTVAGVVARAIDVRKAFEIAVVKDHMPHVDLAYDMESETIRAGVDGSIVVTHSKTQLARNKIGPVLIRPDGTAFSERDAKILVQMEDRGGHDDDAAPSGTPAAR